MSVARAANRVVGLTAYFVELGATVDSETVDFDAFPDADPVTNWPSLGEILEGATYELEEDDDSYKAFDPVLRRWVKKTSKLVIADYLNFKTRGINEFVERIAMGLDAAVSAGTAQTAFEVGDRYVQGWLLIQAHDRTADHYRLIQPVSLRVTVPPKIENKVQMAELRAEFINPGAGSVLFVA